MGSRRPIWLVALGCIVVLAALVPAASGQDWLQGRYDAVNSAFSPSALTATPQLLWTFAGKSQGIRLHPDSGSAVHAGVLFTSADKNPTNIEGNAWSEFYAFDATTGQKLWTYDPNVLGAKHDGLVAVDVDVAAVLFRNHSQQGPRSVPGARAGVNRARRVWRAAHGSSRLSTSGG